MGVTKYFNYFIYIIRLFKVAIIIIIVGIRFCNTVDTVACDYLG